MGVYIKGMEMPENCALCPVWDAGNCLVASETIICEYTKRPSDCPIVPVPPHGRLVDADRLLSEHIKQKYYHLPNGDTAIPIIDVEHAPTIIQAEEGE